MYEQISIYIGEATFGNSVLSSLVATFIIFIITIVFKGFKFFKKDTRIIGDFYISHINFNEKNEIIFIDHSIKIRRRYFKQGYSLKITDLPNSAIVRAKGYAVLEDDHLIAFARSQKSQTNISYRFSIVERGEIYWPGFGLTRDYAGQGSINTCVISREQIDESQFIKLIKKKFKVNTGNRIISMV